MEIKHNYSLKKNNLVIAKREFDLKNFRSFHDKGFLLVKKLYTLKELKKIKKNINLIKNIKPKKFVGVMKYYEKDTANKRMLLIRAEYFYKKNVALTKLIDSNKIKVILKKLTGGNCVIFKEKINFKPPGSREDKLHQDMQGDWEKYSKNFISALISIDKSTNKMDVLSSIYLVIIIYI